MGRNNCIFDVFGSPFSDSTGYYIYWQRFACFFDTPCLCVKDPLNEINKVRVHVAEYSEALQWLSFNIITRALGLVSRDPLTNMG